MGTPLSPPQNGGRAPKFSSHVYCGQTAGWSKTVLGTQVGLSPGDLAVLDGDSAPSPKRGQSPLPNFQPISIVAKRLDAPRCHLAWSYASCQGTLCYMGTQPFPKKGADWRSAPSPKFSAHVYCGQTAGWMKMALGMEVGLSLDDFVSWGPSPLPQKGPEPLPNFRQISTVLKRLDASQWHLVWR